MDRMFIDDLLIRCIIGVNESERREKQDVLVSLSIFADLSTAGQSDRIEDSIDYRILKKKIMEKAEESEYFLVEALAESIAALCLEHSFVRQVRVRVEKPCALRFARAVGVEIDRSRGSEI